MRITALTSVALAMAASAQGHYGSERHVTVCLNNTIDVPVIILARAKGLASGMFAGIGITLDFLDGRPAPSQTPAIAIEFVSDTPAGLLPGTWAYALPYEGVHIRIFWDRIEIERSSPELLAHVMVHEITHILQGTDRHSGEGIMNTRWTNQERQALERKPLHFTEEDVDLIYRGRILQGTTAWAGNGIRMPR
jgi:hypothetical protein